MRLLHILILNLMLMIKDVIQLMVHKYINTLVKASATHTV